MFVFVVLFSFISVISLSQQSCSPDYAQAFLAKHNELRAKHGAPAMSLADEISASAQSWADHLASTNGFEHSNSNKYGENLYYYRGAIDEKGDVSVQFWYDEIKDYPFFGQEPDWTNFEKFGHFTQLVWVGSTRLGVGCGVNGDYLVIVGQYEAQGNVQGTFASNVLAAGSAAAPKNHQSPGPGPSAGPAADGKRKSGQPPVIPNSNNGFFPGIPVNNNNGAQDYQYPNGPPQNFYPTIEGGNIMPIGMPDYQDIEGVDYNVNEQAY